MGLGSWFERGSRGTKVDAERREKEGNDLGLIYLLCSIHSIIFA